MNLTPRTATTTEGRTMGSKWGDECEWCGVHENKAALRAIKMQDGGRELLCIEDFVKALDTGEVDPSDPRVDDGGSAILGVPNAPRQHGHGPAKPKHDGGPD